MRVIKLEFSQAPACPPVRTRMERTPALIFLVAATAAAEGHYVGGSRPVYSESVWHISPAAESAPSDPNAPPAPIAAPREERGKSFSSNELRGLFRSSGWRFNSKIAPLKVPPKWPPTSIFKRFHE